MTLIRIIELENGLIEIHYNPILKKRPYLVRIFNCNNEPQELRLEKNQIDNLYNILEK
jgi:hypothetical protein